MAQDALSEQSLTTKQTLKEAYFPYARGGLASLMINMSIEGYPCTPVQEQLTLLSDFSSHISQYKCAS